jgi:hypothetical protein
VTGKNKKDNKNLSEAVQAIEEQERQLQEATYYTMGTRDKFERLYALIKSYFQVNPKFHQAGHISKRWRQEIERWIQARNEWFNKFSVQDSQEILAGVETEDGSHCYSPGWGAKLFTATDVASGDNCSICTEPLHTNKARKLPCNRVFHLGCVKTRSQLPVLRERIQHLLSAAICQIWPHGCG